MFNCIDAVILKKIFVVQNFLSEIPNVGIVEKWFEFQTLKQIVYHVL